MVWHDAGRYAGGGRGPRARLRLPALATGATYVAIGVLLLRGRSGPALALSDLALVGLVFGLVRPPRP